MTKDTELREIVNQEVICILRWNSENTEILLDEVKIKRPMKKVVDDLVEYCGKNIQVKDLIDYVNSQPILHKLNGKYKYCEFLEQANQGVFANHPAILSQLIEIQKTYKQKIDYLNNLKLLDTNAVEQININYRHSFENIIKIICNEYPKWEIADSINKCYRECRDRPDILTFSHRLTGWSNPIYKLTNDLYMEIKTNFGYGRSSYFFTKLRYKDIDIIPYSELILYRHRKAAEIIRYSQKYPLKNSSWVDALNYAKDSCNASLLNLKEFINRYIFVEAEKMIYGLELMFKESHFQTKGNDGKPEHFDLTGRPLLQFRAEKICGAIGFMDSLLSVHAIVNVEIFIKKIKLLNIKIKPQLTHEIPFIENDLEIAKLDLSSLLERKSKLKFIFDDYLEKRKDLIKKMLSDVGGANILTDTAEIDYAVVNKEFCKKYPEFKEVSESMSEICNEINEMQIHTSNLNTALTTIKKHIILIDKLIESVNTPTVSVYL